MCATAPEDTGTLTGVLCVPRDCEARRGPRSRTLEPQRVPEPRHVLRERAGGIKLLLPMLRGDLRWSHALRTRSCVVTETTERTFSKCRFQIFFSQ